MSILVAGHDEIVHDEGCKQQQEGDACQGKPVHLPVGRTDGRSRGALLTLRPDARDALLHVQTRQRFPREGCQLAAQRPPLPGEGTPPACSTVSSLKADRPVGTPRKPRAQGTKGRRLFTTQVARGFPFRAMGDIHQVPSTLWLDNHDPRALHSEGGTRAPAVLGISF